MKPFITQIELEKAKCCGCNRNLVAPFPEDYDNSSFGPKLISFLGVCSPVYRMSKHTTQTLLKTLYNIDISVGSIPAMERKLSKGLKVSYDVLADKIHRRKVAYVDRFMERAVSIWMTLKKQGRGQFYPISNRPIEPHFNLLLHHPVFVPPL